MRIVWSDRYFADGSSPADRGRDALAIYGTGGGSRSPGNGHTPRGWIAVALFYLLADAPFDFRTPQDVAHRARPPTAPKHE
jgi:hypothetical protein